MIEKRSFGSSIIFLFIFSLSQFFFPSTNARAIEIINTDSVALDLSGSLKGFYLGIHDNPFGKSHDGGLSLLRLILSGRVSDNVSIEFHLLEGGRINPPDISPTGFVSFSNSGRFRAKKWDHMQTTHKDFSAQVAVDRAGITISLPSCDLTVGRQAISFGTTYFWNPNDLLTAFSPYEFDRDYKPGVDAVKADIALGTFTGINLVYSAGKNFQFDESALLLRAYSNILDFDVALMGGWFHEDGFAGADFSGEVGPGIGVRGELACFAADNDDDFIQAVAGAEYRFENSLYLSAEYFFNGFGTRHTSRYVKKLLSNRVMDGDIYNISRHYFGILGSYEVNPLLVASLWGIINLSDHSMQISPSIIYSIGDNTEFVAGMIIGMGRGPEQFRLKSEFGAYPDFTFIEIKYYF